MIFASIADMCEEDPELFICVLIDEVESIAGSRESSMHGEAQDSLRATNALLTGLDRAKKYPNIILLCTSNMLDCLDAVCADLIPHGSYGIDLDTMVSNALFTGLPRSVRAQDIC